MMVMACSWSPEGMAHVTSMLLAPSPLVARAAPQAAAEALAEAQERLRQAEAARAALAAQLEQARELQEVGPGRRGWRRGQRWAVCSKACSKAPRIVPNLRSTGPTHRALHCKRWRGWMQLSHARMTLSVEPFLAGAGAAARRKCPGTDCTQGAQAPTYP